MRKLKKVAVSIDADGEIGMPLVAVMTERELSSIKKKIIGHLEKCNTLREAEIEKLQEKLAELEG